jgi:hypothetical protein
VHTQHPSLASITSKHRLSGNIAPVTTSRSGPSSRFPSPPFLVSPLSVRIDYLSSLCNRLIGLRRTAPHSGPRRLSTNPRRLLSNCKTVYGFVTCRSDTNSSKGLPAPRVGVWKHSLRQPGVPLKDPWLCAPCSQQHGLPFRGSQCNPPALKLDGRSENIGSIGFRSRPQRMM